MKKTVKKAGAMICMLMALTVFGTTVCASSGEDAKKAEYYKEYQAIIQRLAGESEMEIGLLPASEFAEEDWRSPEEFEKMARQLMKAEIADCENEEVEGELLFAARSSVSAAKSKSFTWGDGAYSCTIRVSASFKTQYNAGRQYISSVSSISSQKTGGVGTWSPIGSDYRLLDSGRTAEVTVSGQISYAGVYATKILPVEFYCNANGGIS